MPNLLTNIPYAQAVLWMSAFTLFCVATDTVLLLLLPRLRLSFGPIDLPLFLFSCGRLGLVALGISLLSQIDPSAWPEIGWLVISICLLQSILTILAVYGLYVEPFRLAVTELSLPSAQFYPDRALRILQLSDLHVERLTSREYELLARIELLRPDLILLTGDYLNVDYNTDPLAIRDARLLLSKLHAPLGIYAIYGSPGADRRDTMTALFDGLPINVLDGRVEKLSFPSSDLYLLGVSVGPGDASMLQQLTAGLPQAGYKLLLYHTPDLIETASSLGVDLYLAGHTHAGQIRLPGFGAIVTSSKYWKRYESGKYVVGKTTLYVSRGIGMEGMHMPRIRFLSPPELVVINLGQQGKDK